MFNFFLKSLILPFLFLFAGGFLTTQATGIVPVKNKSAKNFTVTDDLDKYYSNKKLGSFVENGKTYFRLFAPRATVVNLRFFPSLEDTAFFSQPMVKDNDGVWEVSFDGEYYNNIYGYEVINPEDGPEKSLITCIDPYAQAVASFNSYMNPRLSVVVPPDNYDWEGANWIQREWSDLIVYEMHLRDQTAHPSSGASKPGTYQGLIEKGKPGGIDYIKNLGVNTVEFLPLQEFGNCEIPYRQDAFGRFNTWNPYERNHWGYMTAAFFAPESYYAEDWEKLRWNQWSTAHLKARTDFKDVVKAFKKEGIAVIMDVVYNHISEYEIGNFKEIDKYYYLRLNDDGSYKAESGCGNDFKTERPMSRKLIIESLIFWMTEYKVDGFRFDLGKLIDWVTIEEIYKELRKVNPYVIIVCEPWGGGYDPAGFSERGWGSWNDQIRNGIKGENPYNGLGWIFGKWFGNNSPERIKSYVHGTLTKDENGLFKTKEHSVNYLESHDGYTLGDFIRKGLGDVKPGEVILNSSDFQKLTPRQMKLNKLGALFLYTSQGILMIHAGQEFGRSKIVPADLDVNDPLRGQIDHNTYDKDNAVNYINYNDAKANQELIDYYAGLAAMRTQFEAFRRAEYDDITFHKSPNEFSLMYSIEYKGDTFIVIFNANTDKSVLFNIPSGNYDLLANGKSAGTKTLGRVIGGVELEVETSSGVVLKKIR